MREQNTVPSKPEPTSCRIQPHQGRQMITHGVSHGTKICAYSTSPVGATEVLPPLRSLACLRVPCTHGRCMTESAASLRMASEGQECPSLSHSMTDKNVCPTNVWRGHRRKCHAPNRGTILPVRAPAALNAMALGACGECGREVTTIPDSIGWVPVPPNSAGQHRFREIDRALRQRSWIIVA